jgi:hypothetical protein
MQRNPRQPSYAIELERALRTRIRGEVRFDAGSRALYATDASNYRQCRTRPHHRRRRPLRKDLRWTETHRDKYANLIPRIFFYKFLMYCATTLAQVNLWLFSSLAARVSRRDA